MEILSYPIGILVGLFPVILDLGPSQLPAHLLLDGRTVCAVTAAAPGCTIDLGLDPRIHRLDLVRSDDAGRVSERVTRWINRPGLTAEVHAAGDCEDRTRTCTFRIAWAHPGKQDPKKLTVNVDGVIAHEGVASSVRIRFPDKGWPPQVISVDAVFPDGLRANTTRLLRADYPEETSASLQAVPLRVDAGIGTADLSTRLEASGWPVKALEDGEAEVVFVIEPRAFSFASSPETLLRYGSLAFSPITFERFVRLPAAHIGTSLEGVAQMRVVTANEALSSVVVPGGKSASPGYGSIHPTPDRSLWLRYLSKAQSNEFTRVRTADAVVAAGYSLAASPRRRLLVLVLGDQFNDESVFTARGALEYLRQALVPLVVWRVGGAQSPDWPEGTRLINPGVDLARETALLRFALEHQRVAWLDGRIDLRVFRPLLPPGIRLAGREDVE